MSEVSILLSSYKRPALLKCGLSSILKSKPSVDYEILVLNDGIPDGTEEVCKQFSTELPIRYLFTGHRNLDGVMKHRVSGFTQNIGIKHAEGDIIILSCPEIYHLNNATDIVYEKLLSNPNSMVIPDFMYFDLKRITTDKLTKLSDEELRNVQIDTTTLEDGPNWRGHIVMPYFMAIYKHHLLEMGGYDEDFVGYAAEDNDLVERLKLKGLTHLRTDARVVHLWHEGTGDGTAHLNNSKWVYNQYLLETKRGTLVRNEGREWGRLEN